jgi:hypothetical protein
MNVFLHQGKLLFRLCDKKHISHPRARARTSTHTHCNLYKYQRKMARKDNNVRMHLNAPRTRQKKYVSARHLCSP